MFGQRDQYVSRGEFEAHTKAHDVLCAERQAMILHRFEAQDEIGNARHAENRAAIDAIAKSLNKLFWAMLGAAVAVAAAFLKKELHL